METTQPSSGLNFLDLPRDILDLIFPHLRPKSFLALCATNKQFHELYQCDSLYWRVQTSNTFRLPISPLLYAHGTRWFWLYKKLRTQTRPFTWGNGVQGGLGFGAGQRVARMNFRRQGAFERTMSAWPTEVDVPNEVGIIVDLQCGGWSTTILNSDGKLFSVGILKAENHQRYGELHEHFAHVMLPDNNTKIRQFSAGRNHVLGLTDDGEVYSWNNMGAPGVKLLTGGEHSFGPRPSRVVAGWNMSSAYIPERGIVYWTVPNNSRDGHPGISFDADAECPVKEVTIPFTGYCRSAPPLNRAKDSILRTAYSTSFAASPDFVDEAQIGEVLNHIVLENYIVFITHLRKVYACSISQGQTEVRPGVWEEEAHSAELLLEVPSSSASDGRVEQEVSSNEDTPNISTLRHTDRAVYQIPPLPIFEVPGFNGSGSEFKDIQGSFRNFVIFTAAGEVLAGDTSYLGRVFADVFEPRAVASLDLRNLLCPMAPLPASESSEVIASRPADTPALQHTGVIAVAFGDYHFNALHANGTITAYGIESQSCGSLGLGNTQAGARFRGLQKGPTRWDRDASLLPVAKKRGRRVWFEREKREWLQWMETALPHSPELLEMLSQDPEKLAGLSEWVEQEGRHWGRRVENQADEGAYGGLGPYFAISIAAAGWSSGALVIVDDEMAERTRQSWIAPGSSREEYIWEREPFPRIRLPDGFELPGEGELRQWREGMPTMQDLGLTGTAGG